MESEPEALNEDLSELTKVEPMRRIELITGVERRRNRSHDEKASIVAESMVPGVVVAEVARHAQLPQRVAGGCLFRRDPAGARRFDPTSDSGACG